MACRYGNVMMIDTTGLSRQSCPSCPGVPGSHAFAKRDFQEMKKYKKIIMAVGVAHQMDPAVICAIISRESLAGTALDAQHCGDGGNAFGLMQIDKRYHKPRGQWNSEEHVSQATEILVYFIQRIQQKFPNWTREQQFKGGIAAYNAGDGNVESYDDVDAGTTGRDYSNDIVARAQWYKQSGF